MTPTKLSGYSVPDRLPEWSVKFWEFLSWQAELGAKEDLGWPAPGQSHQAHAFF